MKKTKIDWADSTWNPVTGCNHGCTYCCARGIANRFGGATYYSINKDGKIVEDKLIPPDEVTHVLDEPIMKDLLCPDGSTKSVKTAYPYYFEPTFHRYKLDEPLHWKKPRTIFVCSMADLFGEWVPDEWIKAVFDACAAAPQHRYLFLTKDPGRYCDLERSGLLPSGDNYWFGATYDHSNWPGHDGPHKIPGRPTTFEIDGKRVHDAGDFWFPGMFWKNSYKSCPEVAHGEPRNSFVSFEPLLYDIGAHIGSSGGDWLIVGAETGNRKGKAICKREWVEHIVEYADKAGKPVFMKESLREIMGDDFRQEFPWEVR